jgi:chitinase domain-containing protein 1
MIFWAIVVHFYVYQIRASTLSSLFDRKLVSEQVHYKDIIDNHATYLNNSEKTFNGITLAYVTPWNNRGYDISKWFKGKFSHLAPVWYLVV